jgi:hypothetical protein
VDDIFSRLIFEIRSLEKRQKLSTRKELRIAIEWLENHQHPEGYWGDESVADTGLALLALSIYGIKERKWRVKGKHDGGLDLGINWLKRVRNADNWETNGFSKLLSGSRIAQKKRLVNLNSTTLLKP